MKGILSRVVSLTLAVMMIVSLMPGVTFTVSAAGEPVVLLTDSFTEGRTVDTLTDHMDSDLVAGRDKFTLQNLTKSQGSANPGDVIGQVLAGSNQDARVDYSLGYAVEQPIGGIRLDMWGRMGSNGTSLSNPSISVEFSADKQNWSTALTPGKGLYVIKGEFLDETYDGKTIGKSHKDSEAWIAYTVSLSAEGIAAVDALGGDAKYVKINTLNAGKFWQGVIREVEISGKPELPEVTWDSGAKAVASEVTQTSAKLTWDAAADASSYRVTRTAGSNTVVKNVDTPEITYDDLAAGTEYSVSIDAVHSTGWTISTAPLTGSFTTEAAAVDPEPEPEPEQPTEKVLLLQDTFDDNRTDPEAKVYSQFTMDGPLKMWDVYSKGSDSKPAYKIGQAMRGQKDAFSGNFKFGYETEEPITDFEVTAWCGMNSNGRDDNFNGTFTLSTDANGANAVTLTKVDKGVGDYTATITKEFDDFKGDGAMLEVEIKLTDDGKAKLAAQEGLRYWKFETTKARTWAGIFREVRLYGTREIKTEVFEHKQFVGQEWADYMDGTLSKNLNLIAPTTLIPSAGEGYPQIDAMFRAKSEDAYCKVPVEFVYSVAAINAMETKEYAAFSDYDVWIAINGGDVNAVGLAYSTDGQNFVPLTVGTDYSLGLLDPQPKDTYPGFSGDKNYAIYELKALKALPEGVKYFKIISPALTLAKRFQNSYAGGSFTMLVDSSAPSFDWKDNAKITASNITQTGATLTWPAVTAENVSYKVTLSGGGGEPKVQTVQDTTVTYSDLTNNTKYDVSIDVVQGDEVKSAAPLTGNFSTLKPTFTWADSDAVTATGITKTEATVNWPAIPGAIAGMTYRVTRTGGSVPDVQTVDGTSIAYTGLLQGTSYDVSVEALLDGEVVSTKALTGSFRTEAPDTGSAFSRVFTFDNADNLFGGMVEYGWGDAIKEVPEDRPDWAGRPQYAGLGAPTDGKEAFFEQHTLNLGTADAPEMVNGMGRVNETAKNKDGYIIYDVAELTSFSVEFIMGNYNGATPSDPVFYISSNEDYTSWTSYEKLNGVASRKDIPEERDAYGIYTYMSNNIPEGTRYLRIQFPRPTDAKAYDQVNIKKVKLNFNAEQYGLSDIKATSVGRNDISIEWTPVAGADAENITYYLLQDYSVVDEIKGSAKTTYSASGLDRGVEYRYSLVAMNHKEDGSADLSANYVELPVITSAEPGQMVDQYKFPDNLLDKMDADMMAREAGDMSNNFTYDSAAAHTLMKQDKGQAGVVVYHQPNMTAFDITLYLWTGNYPGANGSGGDIDQTPTMPQIMIAGADGVFSPATVSPADITLPGRYQSNDQTISSSGKLPEGTEYLKIVFGPRRVDCTKLRQVRINYDYEYAYNWAGDVTEPTVTEHTDTRAAITWPALVNPPANYEFIVYKNGAEVARMAPDAEKSYVFDDLTPGSKYSFGVQAINKEDTDLRSSMLETEIQAYAREDIWGGNTPSFKDYTNTSVTLVMPQVPNATVTKYIIRDSGNQVVAEVTDGNEYTMTGLTAGSEISYTIQAVVDQDGTTRYTSFLLAKTVLDPTLEPWPVDAKINVTNLSDSGATLTWDAFGNMSGRKYSIAATNTENGTTKKFATEKTNYDLTGLEAKTPYDITISVVDGGGQTVSHNLALRLTTLRLTQIFTDFRGSDLTYADTTDWAKGTYYYSATDVPNVVHLNQVKFELKLAKDTAGTVIDPLGPVWGGFYRKENNNAGDAYIVYDAGETLSEILVRTLVNDSDKSAVAANRPKIEWAEEDGKPQSAQGSFNINDHVWTEVDYKYANMEIIGTTGEFEAAKGQRKSDNNMIDTTVTNLPAGARYFRIYIPNVAHTDKKAWRQWVVGVGGRLYDEVEAALRDYDFNNALTAGDTIDRVSHDLKLPAEIGGYRVVWSSNTPELIDAGGKQHTENITNGYQGGEVIFTAAIYRNPDDTEPVATRDYSIQVYKNTDGWSGNDFINYDLTQFTDVDALTDPQPASALALSVEKSLPVGVEGGSSFSWSIKEETEYAKIEEGKLVITQKLGEDVPLTLVLTATKDGATQTREYPINIIQSYGTPINVVKPEVSSNSGKKTAVTKAGFGEYWENAADDTECYIQYPLGGSVPFMTVVLGEVGDNVQSYKLMTSEDGSKWTAVYTGQTLGHAKQIAIPLAQQKPKYFRAEFTPKAGTTVKIAEFLLLNVALNDQQIIDSTFNMVNLPRTTSTDLKLDQEWLEGVTVTWQSSNPSVISTTGKVTRGFEAQTVTLTATVTYNGITESRDYTVTVLKKNSSGGSISSGGGGGGGGGGGLPYVPGNENPVQPNENENINQNTPYKDVSNNHWAYGYIKTLTDKKVVSGSGDGYFYPENSVTREEFLKMILSAANIQVSNEAVSFADVDGSAWYAPYVSTAYRMGIVKGIDENRFGIGENIQRQDMAVMADRMLALMEKETEGTALDYKDKAEISDYAVSAVENLAALKIMNGDENQNFLPRASATRAESAKIVCVMSDLAE